MTIDVLGLMCQDESAMKLTDVRSSGCFVEWL